MKSQSLEYRALYLPNGEILAELGLATGLKCSWKDWLVLLNTPNCKRYRGRRKTKQCDCISSLEWSHPGIEPEELSEVAGNHELLKPIKSCHRDPSQKKNECKNECKLECLMEFLE